MATGDLPRPTKRQRRRIDATVGRFEALTGLQLCVVLGRTGEGDPRQQAEGVFVAAGLADRPAVMVLVDPPNHHVEVVTSPDARERISDDEAAEAVRRMTEAFRRRDLVGGLVTGVEHLAECAGPGDAPPGGTDLTNLLDG